MDSFRHSHTVRRLAILLFAAAGLLGASAQHPISQALIRLMEDGNYDTAQQSISAYTLAELTVLPDSTLFDYYYLKGAINDNQGNINDKIKYLTAAKALCEKSQGIHSPVYVELCWCIGKDLAAIGDTLGAFEIYQAAIIQSMGLYDTSDPDVAWQYKEMRSRVSEWYKNDSLRTAMIQHRPQLKKRPATEDPLQNDIEFYARFENDEPLTNKILIADSLNAIGKYAEAAALYKEISKAIDDNPIAKATVNDLAAINSRNTNDLRSAEELLLENLVLLEQHKDTKEYRRTHSLLASTYLATHNYEKARNHLADAKYLYEEHLDFSRAYILCLHRCAYMENEAKNFNIALLMEDVAFQELYKNAAWGNIVGQGTQRDGFLADMLSSSALFYKEFGFFDDAYNSIEESIKIAERHGWNSATYYNNLSQVAVAEKDYKKALTAQLKAYEVCKDSRERIIVSSNLGILQYLAKEPIDADILRCASNSLHRQTAETFAYLSADERRNYWKFFQHYLPWINFVIYQSNDSTLYGNLYDNILQEKGLLLRTANNTRQAIVQSGNSEDLTEYDQLLTLRQMLQMQPNNEALAAEIERIDKNLTKKYSPYASFSKSVNVTWQDIAQKLGDDEIAIEFYNIWTDDDISNIDRYCAVIVKKGYETPHIVPLCKKSVLETLLDNDDIYDNPQTYQLLWQPLEAELAGVRNIYFAADGDLHRVGVEYLQRPDGKVMNDAYGIFRLSSTRLLAEPARPSARQKAVLYGGLKYDLTGAELAECSRAASGAPASRSGDFSNLRYGVKELPKTLTEVSNIAALLSANQGASVKSITGSEGTEESFKTLVGQPADIIHLATHGFFWTQDEAREMDYVSFLSGKNAEAMRPEDYALLRSGLFFSGANVGLRGDALPDNVEDGILTAQELSALNLGNVDMVVMSACQSALGETSGEGVFGLQRGFKKAGANTLLMSLWKVDDDATQLLMTEFYRHYLAGTPKQEALHLAQQHLRATPSFSSPDYWAAFVLLDALN